MMMGESMSRKILLAFAAIAIAAVPALAATSSKPHDTTAVKHSTPVKMHAVHTEVHASLNVSTGLWEVTVTPKLSGQLPVSDAEMAQIPAAQRARYMAAMHAMSGRTRKMRECLTQEKLNKGFSLGGEEGCTATVVSNTASMMEVRETCADNNEGLQSADFKFLASSTTSIAGQGHMVVSRDGRTMKIDHTIAGHWLSSSCGNVKDVEVVQ